MIISKDAEKASDKIPWPLRIKTVNKVGIEDNFFNLIKGIYKKPTGFLLKIRMNIVTVGLSQYSKTRERNKMHSYLKRKK